MNKTFLLLPNTMARLGNGILFLACGWAFVTRRRRRLYPADINMTLGFPMHSRRSNNKCQTLHSKSTIFSTRNSSDFHIDTTIDVHLPGLSNLGLHLDRNAFPSHPYHPACMSTARKPAPSRFLIGAATDQHSTSRLLFGKPYAVLVNYV